MNQNKCTWGTLAASIFVCGLGASLGHAQTSDALLNKLVNKGIITADEAKELSKESAAAPAVPKAESKMPTASWVNSLKFYGDFRARYDGIFQHDGNAAPAPGSDPAGGNFTEDRHQLRYRLRFGVTADLTDHFEVGLRLASGQVDTVAANGSPFSANTTLNNDAGRKPLFIDLAYAKWTPAKWAQVEVGKMNNTAWWFTDMVLDPDYNPEGAQEKFGYDINESHRVNFTSGQWVIQENFTGTGAGNNNDVYIFMNQVDWTAKWTPHISSRVGAALMNFKNQHDISAALEASLNQRGQSALGDSINPIIARGEVTYTLDSFPCFQGAFPITGGAEYANNSAAGSHVNEAYNFGATFGSNKQKGNWQLSYNYKNIESAAVWHGINDDDFGFNAGGGTDVRGHQVIASYHVYNPFMVNVRYMRTEQIGNAPGTQAKQDRLFFDLLWSF